MAGCKYAVIHNLKLRYNIHKFISIKYCETLHLFIHSLSSIIGNTVRTQVGMGKYLLLKSLLGYNITVIEELLNLQSVPIRKT